MKNAGIAYSTLSHSISESDAHKSYPTITNAGAVICDVTTLNSGEKNKLTKNKIDTTTLENPVFAPTSIPDKDSIHDVVLVVPKIAPTHGCYRVSKKCLWTILYTTIFH